MIEQSIRTELYLAREATTIGEAYPECDYPTHARGLLVPHQGTVESRKLGQFMIDEGIKPSRIFVAPQPGCITTAMEAALEANYSEPVDMDCALQDLSDGRDEDFMFRWASRLLEKPAVESGTEQVLAFVCGEAIERLAVDIFDWSQATKLKQKIGSASLSLFVYDHGWSVEYLSRTA